MLWKKHDGSAVTGTKVAGDKTAPPTTRWNIARLWLWGWKTVAIFTFDPVVANRGYRLGYKAHSGRCKIPVTARKDARIAVRIGHEDCVFFALDLDGNEIPLGAPAMSFKADAKRLGIRLV